MTEVLPQPPNILFGGLSEEDHFINLKDEEEILTSLLVKYEIFDLILLKTKMCGVRGQTALKMVFAELEKLADSMRKLLDHATENAFTQEDQKIIIPPAISAFLGLRHHVVKLQTDENIKEEVTKLYQNDKNMDISFLFEGPTVTS